MNESLSREDLLARGPLHRLASELILREAIDSTNALLLSRAAELPDGTLAVAEHQTAGRGRLGRSWLAPPRTSLLLSVLVFEPLDTHLLALGGVLAAVAARAAIECSAALPAALRWPNDLVLDHRKVGGVLVETRGLPPRGTRQPARRAVVIGVGINCTQTAADFPPALAASATSIDLAAGRPVDRRGLAGALVAELDQRLARTATAELWPELRREWRAHCADVGQRVTLRHDGREFRGTILDLSEEGELFVQLDDGTRGVFGSATTTRDW
jgi:BirA family biotin operon repressor/biotin-[acetyl-CoA-carboxylase] ligase